MLSNLYIENIAVIKKVSIDFSNGFNVMTGETGAGKSIVIDSINLILGQRAPKDIIRTGAEKAFVSASFNDLSPNYIEIIKDLGFEIDEDGLLMIQREISLNGKNICKINSRPATVSVLKQIGQILINIHGQHENFGLLSTDSHLEYIDNIGGLSSDIERFKKEFNKLKEIQSDLNKINSNESEKERKIDLLKYQINEIEQINPLPNEDEELKKQREIYVNSEKISTSLAVARSAINGDDERPGALQLLETAVDSTLEVSVFIPKIEELYSRLQNLVYELEDCSSELLDVYSDTEYDPAELESVEERLDSIYKLTRKYGSNVDEVLLYLQKAKEELENIEFSELKVEKLEKDLKESKMKTMSLAEELSKKRKKVSESFSKKVKKELEFLAMPGVRFQISDKIGDLTSKGIDELEFLISTNPGEPPKQISKIASGGELSRIMLAIKSVIADKDNIDTLIFDEIDIGISGGVSQRVGLKLKEVSKNRQVICVTHSAQIAALADIHFLINKTVNNGMTYTNVNKLSYNERKNELARIIGGEDITDVTLANAAEILETAQNKLYK